MQLRPEVAARWGVEPPWRVEVVDVSDPLVQHPNIAALREVAIHSESLSTQNVPQHFVGLLWVDGVLREELAPGRYLLWATQTPANVKLVDRRERTLDVDGQEMLTADEVWLRLNAWLTHRVVAVRRYDAATETSEHLLYRAAQLVLRRAVGQRTLPELLSDRESLAEQVHEAVQPAAERLGLEVVTFGVRDVILLGETRALLARVTEARKTAEANLIARREEAAAMRSQANTAKLLADNPALLRMRELEALQQIATSGQIHVLLGDASLREKVVNML